MNEDRLLQVKIIIAGELPKQYTCASLRFSVPDGSDGEGGGWVGIRPGHEKMLAALAPGEILLFHEPGGEPERLPLGRGFLSVENDEVNIIIG